MNPIDFKNMYLSDDPEQKRKSKVLFKMAEVYRDLGQIESRIIDNKTTWFVGLNAFLFAALGVILANYRGEHLFLIVTSLVFAILGCVLAIWVYRAGMNNACEGIFHLQTRWIEFLNICYDCELLPTQLNTNCYLPPIMGHVRSINDYISADFDSNLQKIREASGRVWLRTPRRLAHVMAGAWIALFIVVLIFNAVPCLKQSVQNCSSCSTLYASQGGTASPITSNYGSLHFNVEVNPNP